MKAEKCVKVLPTAVWRASIALMKSSDSETDPKLAWMMKGGMPICLIVRRVD